MSIDESSARVIDTNEIMEERIRMLRQKVNEDPSQFEEAQFPNQLEASEVAKLLADDDADAPQEGFQEGVEAEVLPGVREEAAGILESAENEARQIIENAQSDAEGIKQSAQKFGYEEGKKEGYDAGRIQAMAELQSEKALLEEKSRRLDEEYERRLEELEPMLVDALTDIYEHVIHATFEGKKDLIVKLLADTIRKVEGCKDFIVHVSRDDYEQVKEKKEELTQAPASATATVEIVEDYALAAGECMVETENGIYDCSLDVQLSALREQIRLLSYHKE